MNTRSRAVSLAIEIEGDRTSSSNFQTNQFFQDHDKVLREAERGRQNRQINQAIGNGNEHFGTGSPNRTILENPVQFFEEGNQNGSEQLGINPDHILGNQSQSFGEGQNVRENGSEHFGLDSTSRIFEDQPRTIELEDQNNDKNADIFERGLAQMRKTEGMINQLAAQFQEEKSYKKECNQRFDLLWSEALRWNSDFSKFAKTIYAVEDREEHFDARIQNLLQTQLLLSERVENLQEKLGNLSREQSTRAFLEDGHFYQVVQEIAGLKQKLTSVWTDFKENHSKRVVQSNTSVQVGPSVLFRTTEQNIPSQTSNQFVCNNDGQSKTKEPTTSIAYGQIRDVRGQSQNADVRAYGQTPRDVHEQSQNSDVSHTDRSVGDLLRKFLPKSKKTQSNPTNIASQSL